MGIGLLTAMTYWKASVPPLPRGISLIQGPGKLQHDIWPTSKANAPATKRWTRNALIANPPKAAGFGCGGERVGEAKNPGPYTEGGASSSGQGG